MNIPSFFIQKKHLLFACTLAIFGMSFFSIEKTFAATIFSGQTATIRWTSNNVQTGTCLASNSYNAGVWSGVKADNDGGAGFTYTIPANTFPNTDASYTFTFGCNSDPASTFGGAWISASDIINVKAGQVNLSLSTTQGTNPYDYDPTLTFSTNNYYLSRSGAGRSATLSWNYNNTLGTCTASGAWSGTKTVQGSQILYVLNATDEDINKTYGLTCSAPGKPAISESLVITHSANPLALACFIAGTKVLMADGSKKNVEDVTLDDHLMTSGGPQEVMKTYRIAHEGKLYAFNNSGNYFVSGTHPFMTTEGWKSVNPEGTRRESPGIQVSALRVGDNLVLHGGRYMTLTALDSISTSTTVYNFGINGTHDYYADDYLVHNVSIKDIFQKAYASPCKTC